jgi:histidine ammonia-lyase
MTTKQSEQASLHFINETTLDLDKIANLLQENHSLFLSESAQKKIETCRHFLDKKLETSEKPYYGINTGFGYLQNVTIDKHQITELQYNLLQSHACGVGQEIPSELVRLMLFLKIQSLSFGYSGVQVATVQRLIDFYNHGIYPVVFSQGSLGASGDLSPLSHLALPLIGKGKVRYKKQTIDGERLLSEKNWQPISLRSKEGLALINGTQFMAAYGVFCLLKSQKLLAWADTTAAISMDAFGCTLQPFHELIHQIRPHKGQVKTAEKIRNLLKDSELMNSTTKQVQDPYSFRCVPQVHGASKDTFWFVEKTFMTEINSVTDNPNIFPEEDMILSGGNFHGQPLALGFDYLAIAMAEIGSISERRTYQLLSGQRSLPLFLVKNPGLHSGLMIPQYTAAGVVSENKQLCTPASIDSIVSSNGQEDHVSMGANAATKCLRVLENLEKILAIELLTATQALEFRRPLQSSPEIEKIVRSFREKVKFNDADRILSDDIQQAINFINN